ncbi:MAG: RNA polymerase sigma factor [Chloroflexia bacterium]|nr:RNA polymerase sigma factor [Chloroflexia bacterium]
MAEQARSDGLIHRDERDDGTLLAAVAAGDEGALRALYETHAGWLAIRLRRALPASAVEDVLQETFVAAWRGAGRFQGNGEVGGWLWGIARRQAALWARREGRVELVLDEAHHHTSDDPAGTAASRTDLDRAFTALGPAGSPARRLARMVLVEDRSLAAVARELDVPVGTVKSRLHHLRRQLRGTLRKEGD